MHHVALDRPGANDGHFDHQVVEGFGLEPRQHGHLRPGFDLEHANGVGAADHLVGRLVLGGNGGDGPWRLLAITADQLEAAAQRAKHAQGEDIHLEQAHQVQVVLVPLDDGAIGHGGIFHRHQGIQRVLGNHETAGMLRQMPRETEQLARQYQHPAQQCIVRIEAALAQALRRRQPFATPAATVGQSIDLVRRQPQRPSHVAYRAGTVVGTGDRRQRRAATAIAAEDVLQHLFAPVVLEIHIDIRRLVALLGQETREQHVVLDWIQLSDAQRKTDY